ncbi:MAG: alpha/beta hydrolase family protein [Nanoarchaeota archaeon]
MKIELNVGGNLVRGALENENSDKLLILVHGFAGNMNGPQNIFVNLSKKLQEKNYSVLRFNFRGFSPSEMDSRDMTILTASDDLISVIKFAKSKNYKKIGILGESMGGLVCLNCFNQDVNLMIFWYSEFDCKHTYDSLFTKGKIKELKEKGFVNYSDFNVGKKFLQNIKKINLYNKLPNVNCPVLFLHGDKDEDVPYKQTLKAFKLSNKPKEMHILKNAEHGFEDEQDQAINLTVNFLEKYF